MIILIPFALSALSAIFAANEAQEEKEQLTRDYSNIMEGNEIRENIHLDRINTLISENQTLRNDIEELKKAEPTPPPQNEPNEPNE